MKYLEILNDRKDASNFQKWHCVNCSDSQMVDVLPLVCNEYLASVDDRILLLMILVCSNCELHNPVEPQWMSVHDVNEVSKQDLVSFHHRIHKNRRVRRFHRERLLPVGGEPLQWDSQCQRWITIFETYRTIVSENEVGNESYLLFMTQFIKIITARRNLEFGYFGIQIKT